MFQFGSSLKLHICLRYASGATIQVLLFAVLAVEIKRKFVSSARLLLSAH